MRRHRTLVVVDSNCGRLSTRKVFLETHGYTVVCVGSADEALKRISETAADMVVADERLKTFGGEPVLQAARAARSGLLTVALNAAEPVADDEHPRKKRHSGEEGLVSAAELLSRIRSAFYKRRGPGAEALARARRLKAMSNE